MINSDAKFEVLINDDTEIKQVDEIKYLGALVDNKGIGQREVKHRITESRKIIGCLNSLWWDKNISRKNKKRIVKTLVESVLCYGSEIWVMNADLERRLKATEMDYLRRSARVSRLQRITNEEIRQKMHAQDTIIDRIERNGLVWFGHLMRMDDNRWPKKLFRWVPPGKKKRGRPRRSWNEGIRRAMNERNLDEEMAQNREAWQRELSGQQQL